MLAVAASPVLQFLRRLGTAERTASLPDRDLLRCFVEQGDECAFAALVQRHGPMVLRVCLQVLHHEQNAEDAFQATFLVLSRKAAALQKQGSLASWLYAVAHHAATDLKRSMARRRVRENRAPAATTTDPLAALTVREGQEILHQELSRLPENYRAPLVLCCLEGLARDEAARQLGWPLGKVKTRLEQARKILGARLVRRGLSLSGAFAASVLHDNASSAALPVRLLSLTVEGAKLFAAGRAPTSAISVKVAALTEGVLRAMLLGKLKSGIAFVLVLGAVAVGAAVPLLPRAAALAEDAQGADPPRADLTPGSPAATQQDASGRADEASFGFGQLVQARFFLRNTGKDPIQVSCPRAILRSYYRSLDFLDQEGGRLPVHYRDEPGVPVGWLTLRLGGPQYAEIRGGFLSIGEGADKDAAEAILEARPGKTYRVQYTLENYGDSKADNLQTGKFQFTVAERGARLPNRLPAEELKKRIAWGTAGKNGLQMGVVLLPVKDENPASIPQPAEDVAKEDSQALQGGWEGQSGERDGKALPDEEIKKIRVSIKGDRMLLIPGAEWTPLKFKLDATKQPRVLYATAIDGPDKDRTVPVIYRLDKVADTLTLCFDERNGKAVPEDFAARKGSGLILLVLKHDLRAPASRPPAAPRQ
jgi:RNA polymerase sigma factor (sigma-70 family)